MYLVVDWNFRSVNASFIATEPQGSTETSESEVTVLQKKSFSPTKAAKQFRRGSFCR